MNQPDHVMHNYSYFWAVLVFSLIILSTSAQAETTFESSLSVIESFAHDRANARNESGSITQVSPSLSFTYSKSKLDLMLDYSLKAISFNGLSGDSHTTQDMKLRTNLSHIPKKWFTQINAGISQANISPDGIQIVDGFTRTSNTAELRTAGLSTSLLGKAPSTRYKLNLSASTAGYQGRDSNDSYGFSVELENEKRQKLGWKTSLTNNYLKSSTSETRAGYLLVELDYLINRKLTSYLLLDKGLSSNENLNEAGALLGFQWKPNEKFFIKVGAGKKGDKLTYTLDSSLKSRFLILSLGYNEQVTSSQSISIGDQGSTLLNVPSVQSVSIDPVLLQEARASLSYRGRRNEVTFSYLERIKNITSLSSSEDISTTSNIFLKHLLSRKSQMVLSLLRQESRVSQANTLDDVSLRFLTRPSKRLSYSVAIRETRQRSDLVQNEYQRKQIELNITIDF
jgi:hypothetical protein